MIIFNQANTERVEYMLDMLEIRGFTFFEDVQGRGSKNGEPRRGTHAWPEMHEVSTFVKESDGWKFEDGELVGETPIVREEPKIGRNDPCPCGSGKKFKKCCGRDK